MLFRSLIWEVSFFKNDPGRIEISVGTNLTSGTNYTGLTNGYSWINSALNKLTNSNVVINDTIVSENPAYKFDIKDAHSIDVTNNYASIQIFPTVDNTEKLLLTRNSEVIWDNSIISLNATTLNSTTTNSTTTNSTTINSTTVNVDQLNVKGVEFTGTGPIIIESGNELRFVAAGPITINGDVVASQPYAKDYTDTAIANLINGAPAILDTLKEISTSLANDNNFATTMTNQLALKASIAYVDAQNSNQTSTLNTSINTKLNISDFNGYFDTRLSTKTTSNLTEGSNL